MAGFAPENGGSIGEMVASALRVAFLAELEPAVAARMAAWPGLEAELARLWTEGTATLVVAVAVVRVVRLAAVGRIGGVRARWILGLAAEAEPGGEGGEEEHDVSQLRGVHGAVLLWAGVSDRRVVRHRGRGAGRGTRGLVLLLSVARAIGLLAGGRVGTGCRGGARPSSLVLWL